MKTKSNTVRLLFATAVVSAAAATFAEAGSDSQNWRRAKRITTFTEARSVGPGDTVTMQCNKCKTVLIRASKHVGPASKGHTEWFAVGSTHTCDECNGEITVVKGKTEDTMQHNCSVCGEGAVTCCVAADAETKK